MEISKAQIKLIRSLQLKKNRDLHHLFVAEGAKCVHDLQSTFQPYLIITPQDATPTQIAQMSSLRTPPGVIGVFHIPEEPTTPSPFTPHPSPSRSETPPSPLTKQPCIVNREPCTESVHCEPCTEQPCTILTLALDGIQDPGNLGTIIRTADWFGIHTIIASPDTADCFAPKVVQATMGALARVRVLYTDLIPFLQSYRDAGFPIYGTLLDAPSLYTPGAIPNPQQGIIIMGNEGNGIRPQVRSLITHPLYIPSYPPLTTHHSPLTTHPTTSESLNVSIATAIVLSEFRRLSI